MADQEGGNGRDEPIIVAMGASAGGIRALQSFFSATPADTGAAFVVIVHLDPDRRSEMPNILASRTAMPVVQVRDRQKIEANHVYVIAPDRRLGMVDHEISAAAFEEAHGLRSPIDQFFRSVAERVADGFALIFSGAGSDGVVGVRAVKESGGIIMVQEPSEAEYPSMTRAAIATGVVDLVLPVRELASRLSDLIQLKRTIAAEPKVDEELLRRVLAHLRIRTGHDFSKYKRSTVLRRIARRMQVRRTDELADYYEILRENPDEAQALLSDLLISVTTFFRDKEAFETLKRVALPQLFENRDPDDALRTWVCGCATGEEAYSIAMLLMDEAGRHDIKPSLQVFASDLDARALSTAREGRYPAAIEADLGEDRLRRFFAREGDGYRVRQELRDIILFAHHDLLKDPPFSRVDLISCRNVLIYLDRELQEQVCSTFNYALNPSGYLMLGPSEIAEHPAGLFRGIDRNARIFQSALKPGDKPRLLPRLLGPIRVREHFAPLIPPTTPVGALNDAAAHRRAVEAVAPPSVLVDESHRVVHLSDTAGRFLQPSGGALTGDVVELVRQELRFELRSALHRAFEQRLSTLSLAIPVQFNGAAHRVLMHVKRVDEGPASEGPHAIVMFIE